MLSEGEASLSSGLQPYFKLQLKARRRVDR